MIYTTATLIESFKIVPLAPQFLSDGYFPASRRPPATWSRSSFTTGRRSSPRIARVSARARPCPREDADELIQPAAHQADPELDRGRVYYKTAVQAANATVDRETELMLLDYQELEP